MSTTSVKASARAVRVAPRKVTEVASLVKGRTVADALVILEHTPRRAAIPVAKVISSARANAENNHKLDPETLVISKIEIGQGFALKRFRPAAHGRALPYKRMTSNILVVVDGSEKVKKTKAKKTDTKAKKTSTDDASNNTTEAGEK